MNVPLEPARVQPAAFPGDRETVAKRSRAYLLVQALEALASTRRLMTHSELFVVRIWHQIAGGFRASVRRVDEEETRHFSRPDEVTRFLTTAAKPDSGSGDAASPAITPPTKL